MNQIVHHLIHKLGGPTSVACTLQDASGAPTRLQIQQWMRRDRVPHWWRGVVKNLADSSKIELSDDEAAKLDTSGTSRRP